MIGVVQVGKSMDYPCSCGMGENCPRNRRAAHTWKHMAHDDPRCVCHEYGMGLLVCPIHRPDT